MEWYHGSIQDVLGQIGSDIGGLADSEVTDRLEKYGYNRLKDKKKKPFYKKVIEQFIDPMVIILIVAAVLSAITGDIVEMLIILAVVLINATMSIIQEGKAENSVEALRKMSSPLAKVYRNGEVTTVKSEELVPGDIVELETGDIIPADIRLIESANMQVDESSLTGESVSVDKDYNREYSKDINIGIGDRENILYSSTIVTYGRGKGVVVKTGHDTEIGKIASTISMIEEEASPLQKKLSKLSRQIGVLVVIVCIIVFLAGLFRGNDILEIFMTSISLAVAAIPEGMTAVVTIVLSLGMNQIAKKNAIVKKLLAVETLGTTTVICSDKTGTLTQNEMTVVRTYVGDRAYEVSGGGYGFDGNILSEGKISTIDSDKDLGILATIAALTNDARVVREDIYRCIGDPTEGALITLAAKAGIDMGNINDTYPRVAEIPFDSDRKMMTTFHSEYVKDKVVSFTKGAPDLVIANCNRMMLNGDIIEFTDDLKDNYLNKNVDLAKQALRVLAYAYIIHEELPESEIRTPDNIERNMIFVGLTGMMDPPRQEAKVAVEECHRAGIGTIMITGDYLETANAIGKELGISHSASLGMMGDELNGLDEEKMQEVVRNTTIFARVSPENKVSIVTALKANGHIVAMTGDGVNDAPAIKKADIGISMGITGTDVAKNTAEMILTDDNFASIVNAVREGRIIYSNIKKFVAFLLSCNIGEVLVMFIAIMAGSPVPLTVIQLLWLNLVTDSFPALALGVEKGEQEIMDNPPRHPDEPIIDRGMRINIGVQSIAIALATLISFYIGLYVFYNGGVSGAQTMAFATLISAELLRSFSARSFKHTLKELGILTNIPLLKATIGSFVLLLVVLYVPVLQEIFGVITLGIKQWIVIILCAFIPFASGEISKIARRRYQ